MPTAPLQVSHLSGLQPPLSQTCQRYHNQQPTDADAADQPNHWLRALRLIQVTITFLLAVRPCVTFGKHCVTCVTCVNCVNCVTCVTCQLDFAFHVSDVSHIITWCHTLQTVNATRCYVAPDSHSNLSRLCHICVTLVSCGNNLSRVLVTNLILSVQL